MTSGDEQDRTIRAGGQPSIEATLLAGGQVDRAVLQLAEAQVQQEWHPGDVILGLYEVRRVTEGFGEDAQEKDYHEGGFGRVYKVWHRGWHRELAVKTPRPGLFVTEKQKETFIRECDVWINLGLHPHIASCYYVRNLGGLPRVFSEYAGAGTLEEWIRTGRLYEGQDEKEVLARMLDVAIQFAWALDYAHEREVVHQDVKPLNALMQDDGTLQVTDFGLASAREVAGLTVRGGGGQTMMVEGGRGYTPAYCSPEQLTAGRLTRRTDVWSWGLSVLAMFQGGTAWAKEEMRTGQLAAEILEIFLEHNNREEREADATMAGIPLMPAGVSELLGRCFQQKPEDRPRTLQECVETLTTVYGDCTSRAYPRSAPRAAEDSAETLNNRGVSLLDLGKREEALSAWDKALVKHAEHLQSTYNRGLVLWRSGRETDTGLLTKLADFEMASPNGPQVALCIGHVHVERADYSAAVEAFKRAEGRNGGDEAKWTREQAEVLVPKEARCVRTFKGHTNDVNSVCLSVDGRWALSGSADKPLRLWEVSSGRCVRIFEGDKGVSSLCLSTDGRWALSGGGNALRLWEVSSGRCVRVFEEHTSLVNSVYLSADGRWALSGGGDPYASTGNTVDLWEVSSGRCERTSKGHRYCVTSVCMSVDGRWALSGSRDNTLRLWEVSNGRCVRTFQGHTGWVESVCLSGDGRWALSGSMDKTLRLWEVSSGRCVRTFEGHAEGVTSACLSADGRWALSGSLDNTLRLWEVSNGRCARTLQGHTGWVESVCLSGDGRWAMSGSEDTALRLWDIARITQEDLRTPAPLALCRVVTAAEALRGSDALRAALQQASEYGGSGNWPAALEIVRTVRQIKVGERDREALDLWHEAGRRGIRKGFQAGWHLRTFEGHTDNVASVCQSTDGRWALSGSHDRTLRLWEVDSGRCVRTFEGLRGMVTSVCLSGDGRWALSASTDRTARLWEVSSRRCVRSFEGHTSVVTSVCLSVDGRWALSGGTDSTLRLWEVSSGRCVRIFEGHTSLVNSVCLSADGRRALSGSADKSLCLWEVSSGRRMRVFEGHTDGVHSVCLSMDGQWALSGSSEYEGKDNTVRLWEVSSGRCMRTFEGHTGQVRSVCLSLDGRWALSGSEDKTLRLWEISSGRCMRTFEGHTNQVKSVCLSADGRWALSGSGDRTIRLWELDWDYEVHEPADWDDGARPYLENFLTLHTPYAADLPKDREPSEKELEKALTREGTPTWTEEDFKQLLDTIANAGYGWLRPEGVRRELEKQAESKA